MGLLLGLGPGYRSRLPAFPNTRRTDHVETRARGQSSKEPVSFHAQVLFCRVLLFWQPQSLRLWFTEAKVRGQRKQDWEGGWANMRVQWKSCLSGPWKHEMLHLEVRPLAFVHPYQSPLAVGCPWGGQKPPGSSRRGVPFVGDDLPEKGTVVSH